MPGIDEMKVLCIGDSNTYGYDPRSYIGLRYPADVRWTDRLRGYEIINHGVNGITVPTNVLRYDGVIRTEEPNLIFVMLGTNDVTGGAGAEKTAKRMSDFITHIKGFGIPILLVAPVPVQFGEWVQDEEYIEDSHELAAMYKEVAEKLGCKFADAGEWDIELTFDGVHFSPEGHATFAQRMQEYLPMLKLEADIVYIGTAIVDTIIKKFDPEPISVTGYKADSCSLNIGGEAVNGAIAAAKLGLKASIMCHLGRDAAGDIIIHELEKYNVDTNLVIRSDEHATPITTMFVADDGNRKSITNSAHRYNFHPEKYVSSIKGAKAIVLGSLLRAPFDDPTVIREVCGFAHENGILVFADTKLPNFSKLTLDDISDSLPLIDYITPNEDEAHYCTGQTDPDLMADIFISKNARNVIIKLGGKGCFFKNEKEIFQLPAHEIDAVDATGAGDNFLAGFASEILRGRSHEDALMFANACGAICTTAVGAGTALENREQVECFHQKNGIKRAEL